MDRHDVVVVGGSIAGASLATVLAGHDYDVLVLERQAVFGDQATSGHLPPWGVREANGLGLLDALLRAPSAQVIERLAVCDGDTGWDEVHRSAIDLRSALPGTPGGLAIAHPEMSDVLLRASTAAGAAVLRGVHDIEITPGDGGRLPVVRFGLHGRPHEREARLVVGADGRASPLRQQLGLHLEGTPRDAYLTVLQVDGVDSWPHALAVMGAEDDTYLTVHPQAGGRMRLYAAHERPAYGRFNGPEGADRFLATFRRQWLPEDGEALARATPCGECLIVAVNDSRVERPFGEGVVLIGDAAGWSDPRLAQGVAVALRDVSVLVDILGQHDDWSDLARRGLPAYGEERGERMRRLRVASTVSALVHGFDDASRRRRRRVRGMLAALGGRIDERFPCAACIVGPWELPAEGFTPEAVAAVEGLAAP
jgi:2-polyprenyl-6-methoxyphenol hydroxylase-like FAD-dependent oxidoreductase